MAHKDENGLCGIKDEPEWTDGVEEPDCYDEEMNSAHPNESGTANPECDVIIGSLDPNIRFIGNPVTLKMNRVEFLKRQTSFSYEDHILIKRLGRETPDLSLIQDGGGRSEKFNNVWYQTWPWLTGCYTENALYCFCCLLFGGDPAWTQKGVVDWENLPDCACSHGESGDHIRNNTRLALLDLDVTDDAMHMKYFKASSSKFNKIVEKNRSVLSRLIDALKFCGSLPTKDSRESVESSFDVIFQGLVEYSANIDPILSEHLSEAPFYKNPTAVRDELFDCMLAVCRDQIKSQIEDAKFVTLDVVEVSDSTRPQFALILRHVLPNGNIANRFYGLCNPVNSSADALAKIMINHLHNVLEARPEKLVCQAYDGAAVTTGSYCVQNLVQSVFRNANFVHSFTQKLEMTLLQACCRIPQIRRFVAIIRGFPKFFARSEHSDVLDDVLNMSAPTLHESPKQKWDFNNRLVQSVFDYREELMVCLERICGDCRTSAESVRESHVLLFALSDPMFLYWLMIFNHLLIRVDILEKLFQAREIPPQYVSLGLDDFEKAVFTIKEHLADLEPTFDSSAPVKRVKLENGNVLLPVVDEICDILLSQVRERFCSNSHLIALRLFDVSKFVDYAAAFPDPIFNETASSFTFLNLNIPKLRTELTTMFNEPELRLFKSALPLLKFFLQSDLRGTYSEAVILMNVLRIMSVWSADLEQYSSTLERVRSVFGDAKTYSKVNALMMISAEAEMIRSSRAFNEKVIEVFAERETRREDFTYKTE